MEAINVEQQTHPALNRPLNTLARHGYHLVLGVYSRRFIWGRPAINIPLPSSQPLNAANSRTETGAAHPSGSAASAGREQHPAVAVEFIRFGMSALDQADLPAAGAAPANSEPVMNLPVLGNQLPEYWCGLGPVRAVQHGSFSGQQSSDFVWLQACVQVPRLGEMREIAGRLYAELVGATRALNMPRFVRIWNYIPQINAGTGDQETYRQFCWGRAESLTGISLPAATGIGSHDGWLRIGALCTGAAESKDAFQLRHLENPRQLSAWRYPRNYGPRSPSFARATLVTSAPAAKEPDAAGDGTESVTPGTAGLLLLSGTSSIVHHETRHAGDLANQTRETANNINALLAGLPNPPRPLAMRYYLRDHNQLDAAQSHWARYFPGWPEPAFYHADICRADLDMEIEGVFSV